METSRQGPIILVEDDEDDQEIIKEALQSFSTNKLRIFINGADVLKYLSETSDKPFIIISDINLPKMNGLELRKKINENERLRRKSIPFVFLSTNANSAVIEKAYDLTVQGFFQKPSSIEELNKTIKMILEYWDICKHPNIVS